MIADLKPYSEYKDSGTPGFGQLPLSWHTNRLKNWVSINAKVLPESTQKTFAFSYLDIGAVGTGLLIRKPLRQIFGIAPSRARRIVTEGDTIVSTVRTYLKAVYTVASVEGDLIASTGFAVITPRNGTKPRFVGLLAQSYQFTNQVMSESVGIAYPAISETAFGNIAVAVPPPDEQAAIVRFLDHANRRLEKAIRAKRKVIALLNEQKQAIIHRAVTRGLDPSVPLKPSGIPWLGHIPQRWEVKRIKYLLREVDHRSTTATEPLLSMRRNHGLVLFSEHFTRAPQAATLVGFKIVQPGQFVVNRMQAGNGVIFASRLMGLVSPDYAVFDPIADANVEFLGELFRSRKVRARFRAESRGLGTGSSGFLRLYNDRLGAIHVALPPRDEQTAILVGLENELSHVNRAISRLNREIELLREYRTRLVADVVTGKLDVREAASNVPDEAELPDTPEADAEDLDAVESVDEPVVV